MKECKRSFSYTTKPRDYPLTTPSCADEETLNIINLKWVLVPHGSEHTSFHTMRKNQYEDALFKVELLLLFFYS